MRNVFACLVFSAALFSSPVLAQEDDVPPDSMTMPDAKTMMEEPSQESLPQAEAPKSDSAQIEKPKSGDQPASEQTAEERLDTLFAKLRRERDDAKALLIAAQIKTIWAQSGSATIDLLMQWATKAMVEKRYASALDFLNEAIALDSDYAEAWNRRATVYYLQKDYQHAMYDINRTLELEPRHFGALTSMAIILRRTGLKHQALEAYQKALDVYPMMREVQKSYGELADELTDTRT